MEEGFPRVTAKYPEIQRDSVEIPLMSTIRFRVGTIFDTEVWMTQYEVSRYEIEMLDKIPDNINSHDIIYQRMETQLKENIEEKKASKVKLMMDQIKNANLN